MSKYYVVQVTSVLSKEFLVEAESEEAAEKRVIDLDLIGELESSDWVEQNIKVEHDVDDPAEVGNTMELIKLQE